MGYFAWRWLFEPALDVLAGLWAYQRSQSRPASYLEITPPTHNEKSSLATQQLITVLRQYLGKNESVSLELVSSRKEGIRYLIRTSPDNVPILQRHVASYLPESRFRILNDAPPLSDSNDTTYHYVHEIKQARHYAYPLQPQTDLNQSDPVAFIAGSMTNLQPGESIALQLIITPYDSYWMRRLYNKILNKGYTIIDHKLRHFIMKHWWVWCIALLIAYYTHDLELAGSWALVLLVVSMFFIKREEPALTVGEQQLFDGIREKLGQPLFRVNLRISLTANSVARLSELSGGMESSLAPLNAPFQHLRSSQDYFGRLGQRFEGHKFQHRLPGLLVVNTNIFAASELADVYHFPYGTITTENLVRSHSRTLPAPLSLKSDAKYDIVIGHNHHHGSTTEIGLTAADRQRHVYIIGGTGNGKTTLLTRAMIADLQNGQSFAFIDPHGDAAEMLLRHVPEERLSDVIYFNPDDLARPIGLNLLELPEGLVGDDLLREKDLVTEATISVFRKIFSEEDEGGHRIEYVLRNAIQTALTQPGATLFTVFDLLNDPAYRKQVVSKLQDKDLINFWKHELGKAGDFQRVKMAAGITAKIGRFLFSASAKRIIEQPKSTINFDDVLSSGKILICNFSKGLLGEDTSELFGIMILAKIQLAALRRARLPIDQRSPYHLYVDEFQNFATASFVQMLSEARKYQLFMTLAEQSTSQQKDQRMVQIILANVGTVICFRTGNPADEKLLLPFFSPYIEPGEITNLPAYNFYMRIAGATTQEPFSGQTIPPTEEGSDDIARRLIEHSRQTYGKTHAPAQAPKTSSETNNPQIKSATPLRRPVKKHKITQ